MVSDREQDVAAGESGEMDAVSELEGGVERMTQSISVNIGTQPDEDEIDDSDVVADDDARLLGSDGEDARLDDVDVQPDDDVQANDDVQAREDSTGDPVESVEETMPADDDNAGEDQDDSRVPDASDDSHDAEAETEAEADAVVSADSDEGEESDDEDPPADVDGGDAGSDAEPVGVPRGATGAESEQEEGGDDGTDDHDRDDGADRDDESAESSAARGEAKESPSRAEPTGIQHVPSAFSAADDVGGGESVRVRPGASAEAEPSHSLTADRLLSGKRNGRPAPQGGVRHALYRASGGRVNLGDSKRVRRERERTEHIAKHFVGSARFIPVLSRKGGVGKTTVSVLLGMALADARDDRVIALDANPDRGSLGDRVADDSDFSIRDVLRRREDIDGYTEFSSLVSRDATRLDVLAGDNDSGSVRPFGGDDYRVVTDLASQYYSVILTDTGPGIIHDVMSQTLERADSLVIVSGFSVDEARVASDTLSWLDVNGYADLAANAVVVLNARSSSSTMVDGAELERHFRSRVRSVVTIPYDPLLAAGTAIAYDRLKPATRHAARELAARLVDGIPTQRPQFVERSHQ